MEDVAGIDAELVTSGNTITINVFDESKKPVATKDFTGAAPIGATAGRETNTLAPSGENFLKGEAKGPIVPGAAVALTIKTAEGKSGQAKFKSRTGTHSDDNAIGVTGWWPAILARVSASLSSYLSD